MSENEAIETVAAPASEASKTTKKKVAKKAATKTTKKSAKSTKKAATKKAPVKKAASKARPAGNKKTIRHRMFELLAKNPNGLTGAQVKERLGLSGVPNLLRDEGIMASPPRIRRQDIEGVRGVVYQLTAAGKKALENGTVDSNAPASATGTAWPEGK